MNDHETIILSIGIPLFTLGGVFCYWYGKKHIQKNVPEQVPLKNRERCYTALIDV